jgi:hypothetical protein
MQQENRLAQLPERPRPFCPRRRQRYPPDARHCAVTKTARRRPPPPPCDMTMRVSYETIYKSLFIQARSVLKKELLSNLRSRRRMRRAKPSTTAGQMRGQIVDAISISQRPAEVEDRAISGHWEGDLLSGVKNTHIATLVERRSRFLMLDHVAGKESETVVSALVPGPPPDAHRSCRHGRARLRRGAWRRSTAAADSNGR